GPAAAQALRPAGRAPRRRRPAPRPDGLPPRRAPRRRDGGAGGGLARGPPLPQPALRLPLHAGPLGQREIRPGRRRVDPRGAGEGMSEPTPATPPSEATGTASLSKGTRRAFTAAMLLLPVLFFVL